MRPRVTVPLGVLATSIAAGALMSGQAMYATRRKDLPTVVGSDASGTEGDPSLPAVHVACAGDSTLTGPGLDHPEETWVRLAARSVARDLHVVVQSYAVGGSCVGDLLDDQLDDLLAGEPDVAVIAVGSNDVLHWTPLQEVEADFRLLVTTLSERVPLVVVGGVGDLGAIARIPAPLSRVIGVRGRQIDRIIRRACAPRGNVRYVDVSSADSAFRAGGRHVFTPDLFHPNQYGHAIWAGVAGPIIAKRDPERPAPDDHIGRDPAGDAMTTTDHTVETADGPMRLYEATPDGPPKGAVIVVMEAFGVNAHIEDVTRRAAAAGYHAVSPDLFHRAGGGVAPYDDFSVVMELFKSVSDDGILVDIDAAIAHLRAAGFADDAIGIVGFCFGGRVTFLTAVRRELGAAVTFYGGGIVKSSALPFAPLIDEVPTMKTPWLGLFGDKDKGITVEDVESLRSALDAANPVDHDIVRYDADHGFHCDGRPAVYDEAAAKDGWRRAIAWFDGHLTAS